MCSFKSAHVRADLFELAALRSLNRLDPFDRAKRGTDGPRLVNRFWDSILQKLVAAAQARCIVEIGVATGLLTEKVLEYCAASGAVLHAIDPSPQLDLDEWRERYGERLVFHEARSLDVLGAIRGVDAVFIDGDHNWFTVYHELMLLEETALKNGSVPPVAALHDVDWPYGRRDMYYDPDRIPDAHRHQYRRLGLLPGEMEPVDGGINRGVANAIIENSPRNGVRTAIEDFTAQSRLDWQVVYVPGFHGLGIAATQHRLDENQELRVTIESVGAREFLESWAREIEMARIPSEVETKRLLAESIDALERRFEERLVELEQKLAEARRDAESARDEIVLLHQRVAGGQQVLADVLNSPSWRLTQPLRAAKHSASRLRGVLGR